MRRSRSRQIRDVPLVSRRWEGGGWFLRVLFMNLVMDESEEVSVKTDMRRPIGE